MKLSVCMITKNEEAFLEKALISIKGLADEIIVVDTGSTDNTKKIAESHGAKIYDFAWCDNFSKARNFGLEKATGDWILVLDADETIAKKDHMRIRACMENASVSGYRLIQRNYLKKIQQHQFIPSTNDSYSESEGFVGWVPNQLVRLFLNKPNYRFSYSIHEVVAPAIVKAGGEIVDIDIPIHHFAHLKSSAFLEEKSRRYFTMVQEKIKQHPKNPKGWIELGRHHLAEGEYDSAIEAFEKSMELDSSIFYTYVGLLDAYSHLDRFEDAVALFNQACDKNIVTKDMLVQMAIFFKKKKHTLQAIKLFEQVLSLDSHHPQSLFSLAVLCFQEKGFGKAKQFLDRFLALDNLLPKQRADAYNMLGKIYLVGQNFDLAVDAFEQVIAHAEKSDAYLNLGLLYKMQGDLEKAKKMLTKAQELGEPAAEGELSKL